MKFLKTAFMAMIFSVTAHATSPTGKISKLSFYGSGASEVIFVTIEPKASACPYAGRYVMPTKDRPAMTSALIAAFHAQNTITIVGTGQCHSSWANDEVLNYADFSR